MSTIAEAQARVWAQLLERELAGKSSSIQQIDIERERDGHLVAWFYLAGDDTFAVSFRPPGPMPEGEARRLLMRDPMVVR